MRVSQGLARRAGSYRTLRTTTTTTAKNDANDLNATEEIKEEASEQPWYLRQEESSELTTPVFKAEKPAIPSSSPASLEPLVDSMINLGLSDFKIFDITGRDDIPMSSLASFCVICEGKSEKHLQNATTELTTSIKHQFEVVPYVEGMIKPNSSIKMKKRLKMKKPINDFGVGNNSWIMIDTTTGIFLNLLTPERRQQLNLEYLWCAPADRPIYEKKVEAVTQGDDSIFAGIFRRFYSTRHEQTLEGQAIQSFTIGDMTTFDQLAPMIKNDPHVAVNVMEAIITDLKQSDIHTTLELNPLENKYYSSFNKIFPHTPTTEHWDQRSLLLEILHNLFPQDIVLRMLSTNLLLQIISGNPVTLPQLRQFIQALNKSLAYNPPNKIHDLKAVMYLSNEKANALFHVLRCYDATRRGGIPDEIVLEVLKLYTQHHLFDKQDEVIPVSPVFDVMVNLFQHHLQSKPIVELILVSYLKANNEEAFWSYWDRIYRYEATQDEVTVDNRPWDVLVSVLTHNYHEKLVEKFLTMKLQRAIDDAIVMDDRTKDGVKELLEKFDTTGVLFPQLR